MFYLRLPVSDTTSIFQIVTNTSASLYDTATGIFTAPVSGMYVISWTANVNYKQAQATELTVNDLVKASAYADTAQGGDGDYGSASQTVVLQVIVNTLIIDTRIKCVCPDARNIVNYFLTGSKR